MRRRREKEKREKGLGQVAQLVRVLSWNAKVAGSSLVRAHTRATNGTGWCGSVD